MQIADKVPEGSSRQGSGGFWGRMLMRFQRVPVQMADKVAEVSGAHSRQSSGGFGYKNFPRSSKLLGITHEFILENMDGPAGKSDATFRRHPTREEKAVFF